MKFKNHFKVIFFLLSFCSLEGAYLNVGQMAPELGSGKSYNTKSGKGILLSNNRGYVVLIDFWATWCGPCIKAMPHIQKLHEDYKEKGLVVIAHTDSSSSAVKKFIDKNKYTMKFSVSKKKGIGKNYGVTGIPHAYLLDHNGKILWHGHSASIKDKDIKDALKKIPASSLLKLAAPFPIYDKLAKNFRIKGIQKHIAKGKMGVALRSLTRILEKEKDDKLKKEAESEIIIVREWLEEKKKYVQEAFEKGDLLESMPVLKILVDSLMGSDEKKPLLAQYNKVKKSKEYKIALKYKALKRKIKKQSYLKQKKSL